MSNNDIDFGHTQIERLCVNVFRPDLLYWRKALQCFCLNMLRFLDGSSNSEVPASCLTSQNSGLCYYSYMSENERNALPKWRLEACATVGRKDFLIWEAFCRLALVETMVDIWRVSHSAPHSRSRFRFPGKR